MKKTRIADRKDLAIIINRLSHQILEKNRNMRNTCFVGLQRRGVFVAERVRAIIEKIEGIVIPMGVLDATLYRDDLRMTAESPVARNTKIDFDIAKKTIILFDDVLYTGRTIRAALDELMDFGRPKSIQLAVLLDRGGRELPIQPDFVGRSVFPAPDEKVKVHLSEADSIDEIVLIRKG